MVLDRANTLLLSLLTNQLRKKKTGGFKNSKLFLEKFHAKPLRFKTKPQSLCISLSAPNESGVFRTDRQVCEISASLREKPDFSLKIKTYIRFYDLLFN